ncbi:MAG: hypothetical protein ACI97A_001489 [Planctomycetota bacterium]|jgi:hypothetical protein
MRMFPLCLAVLWTFLATQAIGATSPQNQPPSVSIHGVPLLTPGNTLTTLTATVSDDGLPGGSSLAYSWCKFDGPGPVIFGSSSAAQTTAQFDQAGTYEITLLVSDGVLTTTDTTTVTVQAVSGMPVSVTNILNSFSDPTLDPLYSNRFLTLVQNTTALNITNLNTSGAAYYAQVDPLNLRTTFDDFKSANGFTPGNPSLVQSVGDSRGGCCTAGVYGNAGDLGFGRRMVMNRNGNDISYWVTNYMTVHDAVEEDPAGIILTVCMEYSPTPGASTPISYVKFFMYDGSGNRITNVDFDGRGPKPLPLACNVCHGGSYSQGGTIPPNGIMGAFFLPFDLDQFDYSCEPLTSKEAQETAFKEFNDAILQSDAPSALKQLIEGWYGGFGLPSETQNTKWVPPGWKTEPELYRKVVAQSCRNCHLTRSSGTLNFDESSDFIARQSQISGSLLFGPSPSGFRMPHAEATWERFWLSTSPHQPDMLSSAFSNGNFVGLGAPAGRMFVDAAAVGGNNGQSWTDAFASLDQALTDAALPGSNTTEIWVAGGTYLPSTVGLGNPRDATFDMPDGLKVYGGFLSGDALLEDRELGANSSILSGDLNGDDSMVGKTDNVFHVVTFNQTSSTTLLDGFEIRGGNAVGAADPRGGGVYMVGGAPVLVRNNIVDNKAASAGGMLIDGSGPRLIATSFYGNDGDTLAGGFWMLNGSDVTIENSIYSFNLAEGVNGEGGFCIVDGGTLRLNNCTIYRNYSMTQGGGLLARAGAAVEISNTIFWHNCTSGISDEDDQVFADNGVGVVNLTIDYSVVQGLTGLLGGTGNLGDNPLFVDPNGADGVVGTLDDDLRLQDGSPAVDSGNNDLVLRDDFDLDIDFNLSEKSSRDVSGNERFFDSNLVNDTGVGAGAIVDIGALEMDNPSLLPCAAGNVRIGIDGPHDVVTVNGSSGGTPRLVYIGTGQAMTIEVMPPPGQAIANFALFVSFGIPVASDVFVLDFGIGDFCFKPAPLLPFANGDFILVDNLGLGFGAILGATPAPWSMSPFILGTQEADFVIQGLIWDTSKVIPISVTNGVIVSIRENPPIDLEPQAVVADNSIEAFAMGTVMLDGSASFDPEGNSLSYAWSQIGGAMVALSNADQAIASFTAGAVAESLTFELIVNDGVNPSAATMVNVNIVLDTPIADAGANQSVITDAMVALDGSGSSDPQMQALTYAWTQTGGTNNVVLTGANTVSPTFTAPDESDTLTFSLVVSDGANFSTANTVDVVILTSFLEDVYPIFSTQLLDCSNMMLRCIECHTGPTPTGNLLFDQPAAGVYAALQVGGRVNTTTPAASFLLLKPLAQAAGGVNHGGGDIFCLTSDPNYQIFLRWITEGAQNN